MPFTREEIINVSKSWCAHKGVDVAGLTDEQIVAVAGMYLPEPAKPKGGVEAFIADANADAADKVKLAHVYHDERLSRACAALQALIDSIKDDPRFLEMLDQFAETDYPCTVSKGAFGDMVAGVMKSMAKMTAAEYADAPMAVGDCYGSSEQIYQIYLGWLLVYAGHIPPKEGAFL